MMTAILILGILNFVLIVFQIVTGFHMIKIRIRIHKITGVILTSTALAHGILAIALHG